MNNKRPALLKRTFLINDHFQLHFLLLSCSTALFSSLLFYFATSYFFSKYSGYAMGIGLSPADPFFKVLSNMQTLLTYFFAITAFAVTLFSVAIGLYFSNQVAGPLYRLRQHCDKVARGEGFDDVVFRKGDYFMEVAQAYNRQMAFIRSCAEPGANEKKPKAG